jgi:hypothetical protein
MHCHMLENRCTGAILPDVQGLTLVGVMYEPEAEHQCNIAIENIRYAHTGTLQAFNASQLNKLCMNVHSCGELVAG